MSDNRPIGFFDSGLGGISVLKAARALLPNESYIYYGDSANAPYGEKTQEEIAALSEAVVKKLLARDAKAIVIACNTATGAAVDHLRGAYAGIPIIGVEPAVKPAVKRCPGGRILVMATPQCLKSHRVLELMDRFRDEAEVLPLPCGGLMEFVERGELEGENLHRYLAEKFAPYRDRPISAVVSGCTHYPFLRRAIARELGASAEIIDGNAGIAAQLKRRLEERGLETDSTLPGTVELLNSSPDPELSARAEFLLRAEL